MTEFVLYGGKGGVGKTTVATATALRWARQRTETLVVSTDPAHSLADAVGQAIGPEPVEIRERLWGVEVDPQAGIDRYRSLFEALAAEFDDAGIQLDEGEIVDLFTSGVMPGRAVRESERLVGQLREFEVPVTTLVVNKVIEDTGDCERCHGKQAVQEEAIATLRETLSELDLWTIPDASGEVTGLAALERVGAHIDGY